MLEKVDFEAADDKFAHLTNEFINDFKDKCMNVLHHARDIAYCIEKENLKMSPALKQKINNMFKAYSEVVRIIDWFEENQIMQDTKRAVEWICKGLGVTASMHLKHKETGKVVPDPVAVINPKTDYKPEEVN